RAIKEPDPKKICRDETNGICRAFGTLISLFPLSLLKNRKILRRVNASIKTQSC
ncbi:unnamed protein product, partial [Brassica oleracea]